MLINAGVTHSHSRWLENLNEHGGLLLPLTVAAGMGMGANLGKGVMAKITREANGYRPQHQPHIEKSLHETVANRRLLRARSNRERRNTLEKHGSEAFVPNRAKPLSPSTLIPARRRHIPRSRATNTQKLRMRYNGGPKSLSCGSVG